MYFIVFAAFAMALSLPEAGPPWRTITSPPWTWAVLVGQVLAAGAVAAAYGRLVKIKLERSPAWLPAAQTRLAQGNTAVKIVLLLGLGVSGYLTNWSVLVRCCRWIQPIWGLDELVLLAPFFTALLAAWVALYPADRAVRQVALELRLWSAAPARPVWRLGRYLNFMIRQHMLVMAVPMVPIVVANDFVNVYRRPICRWTHVPWAPEAVLVAIAGLVFLIAPVLLRFIWHTRPLPAGELSGRLEGLCRRVKLRYHRILIWESDGMVVNAAVMGLLRPVRYIMLSDGLLEMMDDHKIEAVFGHEAGHIKHHHILFYLLFAVASMLAVGGVTEVVLWAMDRWPAQFPGRRAMFDYLQVGSMAGIALIWLFGFGHVSRRFEWQADLFGARCVTPPAGQCNQPCFVHGTAGPSRTSNRSSDRLPAITAEPSAPPPMGASAIMPSKGAVCATAASTFAEALVRIAALNGIPVEARSWRHSSIANRARLLRQFAYDPQAVSRFDRSVLIIKAILAACTVVGALVAAWLYWPF